VIPVNASAFFSRPLVAKLPTPVTRWITNQTVNWQMARFTAAQKLGQMRGQTDPLVPLLADALRDPDFNVRCLTVHILLDLKADEGFLLRELRKSAGSLDRPMEVFRWALNQQDPRLRLFALRCLREAGGAAVAALPRLLELFLAKEQDQFAVLAGEALAAMGEAAKPAGPRLRQLLEDQQGAVPARAAAADILGRIRPDEPAIVWALRRALDDSSTHVRVKAAGALWRLNGSAGEVLPTLTRALHHKLPSVRLEALQVLADMGRTAQPALPQILEHRNNAEEGVRRAATEAATKIAPEEQARRWQE
jgi:HEAT repeat protein